MASLLDTVRDLGRLREIAMVLARHGFDELVQRAGLGSLTQGKNAESKEPQLHVRVRQTLEELGPSFVKLGQLLSTRPDLVPLEIVTELKRLQDDVPPAPWSEMQPAIEAELGAPISDIFLRFDQTPLAAASIGQVYRAVLRTDDGEAEVVVKAQRPNIGPTIERDIDLLYWLARTIERTMPESRLYTPVRLVEEFDRAIHAELDFAQEADNAERFADDFAELRSIVAFPKVYRQFSSGKAITLEYLAGKNVFVAVAEGASAERIAKNAVQVVVKMIFEHGFFHADPHPGNILIMGTGDTPVLGLVDLGLVGRLSPRFRDRLVALVLAVGLGDHRAIADALYAMGRPTKKIDRAAYEAEVARLADKYLGRKLGEIDVSDVVRELGLATMKFGIETPAELLMVGKALVTVEGVARQVYPSLDIVAEIKPYFTEIVGYRYSPERLTSDVVHLATRLANALSEFPGRADEILEDLRSGRMSMEVRQPTLEHAGERLGRRIFTGMVVSSLIIAGALLITNDMVLIGAALLALGAGISAVSAIALAFSRARPRL